MGSKTIFKVNESPVIQLCSWAVDIIIVLILAIFTNQYIVSTEEVNNRSMEKMLNYEDVVLVNKAVYKLSPVRRFDIIMYHSGENGDEQYDIKRVVGLPGESVQIIGGELYIDGAVLDSGELFAYFSVAGRAEEEVVLGENEFFVLGDWLEGSEDSRFEQVGNVMKEDIIGKVWFRVQPFAEIGPVE